MCWAFTVYGCFCTTAEMNSGNRDRKTLQTYTLALFRKSLPTSDIDTPWNTAQGTGNHDLCWADLKGKGWESHFQRVTLTLKCLCLLLCHRLTSEIHSMLLCWPQIKQFNYQIFNMCLVNKISSHSFRLVQETLKHPPYNHVWFYRYVSSLTEQAIGLVMPKNY